ncbi:MAG: type III pantothenate kinase, partial [Chloroflexi bacterium]|nr:type III pantothenate kinase [Chloroflexota bacterium]
MLLAIDIGNTNVTLGVFDGEQLRATWRMATDVHRMADEYAVILLNLLHHKGIEASDITDVSMCNVVPPLTTTFIDLSQRYFEATPLVVGAGVKTGVRIRMDNPREVGADRIADAAAAHHLYGGPVITIDLGTTTVFGIVSKEGDYIGGVIATGIGTAAEALYSRTAQLPRVDLVRPKTVIGTNTVAAMQSGIINGYASLIEGML